MINKFMIRKREKMVLPYMRDYIECVAPAFELAAKIDSFLSYCLF